MAIQNYQLNIHFFFSKKKKNLQKRNPWTDEEIEILIDKTLDFLKSGQGGMG